MVQPPSLPVRAVASVTLVGSVNVSDADDSAPGVYRLDLEKALYFGGLDEVSTGCRGGVLYFIPQGLGLSTSIL